MKQKKAYDYLIVGAGIYGATLARLLHEDGKKVLVLDKNKFIGGNCATTKIDNITVHKFGPHIFHTSDEAVWAFVNRFCTMKPFINSPKANYNGVLYSLPFNMNTFYEMWGITNPEEAKAKIKEQASEITEVTNLEEQAISLVGRDIYVKLVKNYTEKQWGTDCKNLDPSIIKRLPVRFTFNNNYFNDKYQGIPEEGYSEMIENMLKDIPVVLGVNFLENESDWSKLANRIVYCGSIDEYFDYQLGKLDFRYLQFDHEILDRENFQGNAVINYTSFNEQFTRITEHKHFLNEKSDKTVITKEYSLATQTQFAVPCYPIQNEDNQRLYNAYLKLAAKRKNLFFGGRLGKYKYLDMDDCIIEAKNDFIKLGAYDE